MTDTTIDAAQAEVLAHDLSIEPALKQAHQNLEEAGIKFVSFLGDKYPGKKYLHAQYEENEERTEVTVRVDEDHSQISVTYQRRGDTTHTTTIIYPEKSICNTEIIKGEAKDSVHSEQIRGGEPVITNKDIGKGIRDIEFAEETKFTADMLEDIRLNPDNYELELLDEPPELLGLGPDKHFPPDPLSDRARAN